MSLIQTDIDKMIEDSKVLFILANRYNQNINQIKKITTKDDFWKGIDAENFKKDLISSCKVYDEVGTILKEYAIFLDNNAKEIDKIVSKNWIE